MEVIKMKLKELKAEIEQVRDEVRLKAHLGRTEAADELEKLEKEWKSLKKKYKPLADEAEKTAENTVAALEIAADELKEGFDRIRKLF
jgi:archaellum component FlaC